jgi:PAS domain-containing protein
VTLEDFYRLVRIGHVQAQGIVDTLDEPLLLLDQSLCVVSANPAFLRTFQVERDSTLGVCLFALGNGQWDIHPSCDASWRGDLGVAGSPHDARYSAAISPPG